MNYESLLQDVLACYPLKNPYATLIRHNENAAYKVKDEAGKSFVLRIHQPREGFSQALFTQNKEAALKGELRLLTALADCTDIPVQVPVKNREGETLTKLSGGTFATLLTWLEGDTLEKAEANTALLYEMGRMTALMHSCFQTCPDLPEPAGHDYDKSLIDRMATKLRDMERVNFIEGHFVRAMIECLEEIKRRMTELDLRDGAFGIVHSDLSKSNMLLCGDRAAPIDFGLWGYGYSYMDLGALASHYPEPVQQAAIFEGYQSVTHCQVEQRYVDPFICLGILLFICTFGDSVHGEGWFSGALERWRNTFFSPLAGGTLPPRTLSP